MDEQSQRAASGPSSDTSAAVGRRRTARLLWLALGILSALAVITGLVIFAPTQVARWIVDRYFAGLGVDVSGVKTLDVDLLRGEVTFGPVAFQAAQAEPGRIGRLGLDLSLRRLVERQVLVRSLIIEDIDLRITQSAEGAFAMNGVPVGAWLQPKEEPQAGAWDIGDWGGGVDSLNLRNARVIFITGYGGEASFTIQSLDVSDVQTWRPEQAGTFSFRGDVNGIAVRADGRAWPFADPARAEGEIAINDVALEKIEQYTGSLNFEKRGGRLSLSSSLLVTLDPERHLQLGGEGVVRLADLDLARADLGTVTMSKAEAPFKSALTLGPGGAIRLAGTLGVNAGQSALSMAGSPAIGFQSLSLPPTEMSLSRAADGAVAFEGKPRLEVQRASIAAPLDAKLESGVLALDGLRLTSDKGEVMAAASGSFRLQDAGAARLALHEAAAGPLSLTSANLDLKDLSLKSADGNVTLSGALAGSAHEVHIAVRGADGGPDLASTIAELSLRSSELEYKTGVGGLSIDGSLAARLERPVVEVRQPPARGRASQPSRMTAANITIDLSRLQAARQQDKLSLSLDGTSRLNTISAALDEIAGRPQAKLDSLTIDAGQITVNTGVGRRIAGRLGLQMAKGEATWHEQSAAASPARGSLARFGLELADLAIDNADGRLTVNGNGAATLADAALTSSVLRPYFGDWLEVGDLRTTLKNIQVTSGPRMTWTARFDAVMRDFGSGAMKGAPQLRTAAVHLNDAQIDDRGRIGAEAVILDKPEADITTAWIESLTAGGQLQEDLERVADEVSTFRLEQFSVLDSWRLGLSDYKVDPPAYFTLKLNTVDIAELDTGKPGQRSRVSIVGTLNEFTQLQSGGWASPFEPKPSFDLFANVRRLQLPPLSPYAVRAAGVNLESGSLRADATAKANAGQLDGVIDINIGDLTVGALGPEQAGAGNVVGVPVDTIIGLLQDGDGRIRLVVPFSGDLTAPAFDFGNAIDKALGGALEAAVTAPFRLAYLPVDLIVRMTESGPPALKPIPFTAGEATVGIEGERVIEALALVLEQRPSLRIKVCGRATRQDRDTRLAMEGLPASQALPPEQRQRLEGELGALAYDRTLAVRSALIREHGISGRQVQECRASYDVRDDGPPRVQIEL